MRQSDDASRHRRRVRMLPFALLLAVARAASAETPAPQPLRAPLALGSVEEKSFYGLWLLSTTPEVARLLREDAGLARIAAAAGERLRVAAGTCAAETTCLSRALRFRPEDVSSAIGSLRRLYRKSEAMRRLVDRTMRESGVFERHRDCVGEELLARVFEDEAAGVNRVIGIYAEGHAQRYAPIDKPMFDVASDGYRRLVQTVALVMEEGKDELDLFFELPLRFALRLLEINGRDEAGRLEPLHLGENLAALSRIASTRWDDFPYSVILVPGSGPDRPTLPLSPWGALRIELGARRFRDGKAPLILVSGGYVYPAHAPFCEALEMKRALIADFGVPADAILIEPHARHTTTNLRNAARLLYRYGIPFEKPLLVTTDSYHTDTIASPEFARRCERELGHVPYRLLGRLSPFDVAIVPAIDALHADAAGDPLDP
jgi:hypothetical protein